MRSRTPARILTGRAGAAYRTTTWLELRRDHAAARDAVRTELDLTGDLGEAFVAEWGLFEVATLARTKEEFLLRPDLGRSLSDDGASRARRSLSVPVPTFRSRSPMDCRPRRCGPRFPHSSRCSRPKPTAEAGRFGQPFSSATAAWARSTTSARSLIQPSPFS